MSAIVQVQDVYKKFGDNEVLKGVSFEIRKGEVVAIIGQSGSGKSTALRCIDHLETINEGEITVCGLTFGKDIERQALKQLRRDVGIVFQSYNLFPHLTVAQHITLAPRSVRNLAAPRATAIAADFLAQVELG